MIVFMAITSDTGDTVSSCTREECIEAALRKATIRRVEMLRFEYARDVEMDHFKVESRRIHYAENPISITSEMVDLRKETA